jgi:hypothetical protein
MEPKGLLLCSHEPTIRPYPKPDESVPHPDILHFVCIMKLLYYLTEQMNWLSGKVTFMKLLLWINGLKPV